MIVRCAKSMCFVRSIYLHVSAVFITKQKSLGWRKTSKRKRTFEFVESIGRKDQFIKHTPSFQFEFVSIVGSKSFALCFRFYGTQVRLHLNLLAHNQKSSCICDQLVANFEPCYSLEIIPLNSHTSLRSHVKNSCFAFHQGFQTPRNNKSTRLAASCFHLFLGVWNP